MMRNVQKLVAKMDQLQAKFDKLGVPTKADSTKEVTWMCFHCRCETCYVSRTHCFKCGEPRVSKPPGLGSGQPPVAPLGGRVEVSPAAPMELEVKEVLEDLISEQEEILKFYKSK